MNKKYIINDLIVVAQSRGGECLSAVYTAIKDKYTWKCNQGHTWKASFALIKNGSWCPSCSSFKSERICRELFEQMFNRPFPKTKPSWLINPKTGRNLELDGFNSELRLAFEHDGLQHYETTKQVNNDALESIKYRDSIKNELCLQNNVHLIRIPALFQKTKLSDLAEFVSAECAKLKIATPKNFTLNLNKAYFMVDEILIKIEKSIAYHQGKIISVDYDTDRINLECKNKHQWSANIYKVGAGDWCRVCFGTAKKDITWLHELAGLRKGKCLATDYKNCRTPVTWQCHAGHTWQARPENIKLGKWCPYCAGNAKKDITWLHTIAEKMNFKCLSDVYVNVDSNYKWQCQNNHVWEARAYNISVGHGCPDCSGHTPYTLERLEALAKKFDGKCLATSYINNTTYMEWQCKNGHIWKDNVSHIKAGRWCRICKK